MYGASSSSDEGDGETARTRTLWITFLACAFLLPLTIVLGLSGAVLRLQRRRCTGRPDTTAPTRSVD